MAARCGAGGRFDRRVGDEPADLVLDGGQVTARLPHELPDAGKVAEDAGRDNAIIPVGIRTHVAQDVECVLELIGLDAEAEDRTLYPLECRCYRSPSRHAPSVTPRRGR